VPAGSVLRRCLATQFPTLPPEMELVEIPAANHMFATGTRDDRPAPLAVLTDAVSAWLDRQLGAAAR
jgi:hypothetical protein